MRKRGGELKEQIRLHGGQAEDDMAGAVQFLFLQEGKKLARISLKINSCKAQLLRKNIYLLSYYGV